MIDTFLIGVVTGALNAIATTVVGNTNNASRWFGIKADMESFAGVILLLILPGTLILEFGFIGIIFGMVILILACTPVLFFLMHHWPPMEDAISSIANSEDLVTVSRLPVLLALAGVLFLFVGASAIWTFLERLATNSGFDSTDIGVMLGVTLFWGVVGSFITGWIGDRFCNLRSYIVDCAVLLAGVFVVSIADTLILFSIGAGLYMMGWSAAVGYVFAIVASVDPDGRHVALTIPAVGAGSMMGPAIAGYIYSDGSIFPLLFMTLVTVVISIISLWSSVRLNGPDVSMTS